MEHPPVTTHDGSQFSLDELVDAKNGRRISVCIPARNEAATVGNIVETIQAELMSSTELVDEIIVVDDHSDDETADVAAAAGAKVVRSSEVLADHAPGPGKGEAMWRSLATSTGDLVVWCDADLVDFDSTFITGLTGPLLLDAELAFVKGYYDRPLDGQPEGGGRVTELMARPALALLFPHLGAIHQPLGGEYAGRRDVLERVPFARGYGVDIGLVIDVVSTAGLDAIAQVDLGTRRHRNRPYEELTPMATEVLAAILARVAPDLVDDTIVIPLPDGSTTVITSGSLPALSTLVPADL